MKGVLSLFSPSVGCMDGPLRFCPSQLWSGDFVKLVLFHGFQGGAIGC